ncbi:MAG: SDR family NAD(P)-dependent oxidoreductase [Pseudomonadota bacterium]
MKRLKSLEGRRYLLTGASSGLGAEMALQLARDHGAHVLAAARRADRLDALAARVADEAGSIECVSADVSIKEGRQAIVSACAQMSLDGIILNAGVTALGPFEDYDMTRYRTMIEINVTANLELIQALFPQLQNRPNGADIFLVTSLAGVTPTPYQTVYSGTKAFLVNFGLSLREELKPKGIAVTVLTPGGIQTEMTNIEGMKKLEAGLEPAEKIARHAIAALKSRRGLVAPGLMAKVQAGLSRYLPRGLVAAATGNAFKSSLEAAEKKPD